LRTHAEFIGNCASGLLRIGIRDLGSHGRPTSTVLAQVKPQAARFRSADPGASLPWHLPTPGSSGGGRG
jgi:hypothetical protein